MKKKIFRLFKSISQKLPEIEKIWHCLGIPHPESNLETILGNILRWKSVWKRKPVLIYGAREAMFQVCRSKWKPFWRPVNYAE